MQKLLSFFGKLSLPAIIGYLVAFIVLLAQAFGYDIHSYAPAISIAVSHFAQDAAALISLVVAIISHVNLAEKHEALVAKTLPSSALSAADAPTPPSTRAKILPLLAWTCLAFPSMLGLSGCAGLNVAQLFGDTASVVTAGVASAQDLLAAAQVAEQNNTGKPVDFSNVATDIQLGVSALTSSNFTQVATAMLTGINNTVTTLQAAGASPSQIQTAVTSQIVAVQNTAAPLAAASSGSTAKLLHYRMLPGKSIELMAFDCPQINR